MTGQNTAEARKSRGQGTDISVTVVSLVPRFNGEPRTPHYFVGQGVFDSAKHCARVCGPAEIPDHAAIGYTPEILADLSRPQDESDRYLWP